MGHIFISYSHKDKEYVHKLADALQERSFEVWLDDRIDYGTRWPLVIENAIDSCESLVLVATDYSHESEWVQHEISRANRLQKPIFPLLLGGQPWLSFESTQYHDVRDGNLPSEKFYETLMRLENNRFEHFRYMATEVWSWPVFRSQEFGFHFHYPKAGELSEPQKGLVLIALPVGMGTNLDQRSLLVHFKRGNNLASPMINELSWIHKRAFVDILGLRFLKEMGDEGGMSHYHELVSYSTSRESSVVTLTLHLTTVPADIFGDGPAIEIDRGAAKEILSYVVSTFTWL